MLRTMVLAVIMASVLARGAEEPVRPPWVVGTPVAFPAKSVEDQMLELARQLGVRVLNNIAQSDGAETARQTLKTRIDLAIEKLARAHPTARTMNPKAEALLLIDDELVLRIFAWRTLQHYPEVPNTLKAVREQIADAQRVRELSSPIMEWSRKQIPTLDSSKKYALSTSDCLIELMTCAHYALRDVKTAEAADCFRLMLAISAREELAEEGRMACYARLLTVLPRAAAEELGLPKDSAKDVEAALSRVLTWCNENAGRISFDSERNLKLAPK